MNAGARIYDPDNAVFLSPDPVLATAGIGAAPYQYAFQNPNSYTDPTGMWPLGTGGIDCLTAGCVPLEGLEVVPDPAGVRSGHRGSGRPDGLNAGAAHGDSRGGGRATGGGANAPMEWDLAVANYLDNVGVDDFFAGMGDSLSFGLTGRFRAATGVDGTVDRSSDAYDNGEWAAVGTSLANIPGLIRSGVRAASGWAARFYGARNAAPVVRSTVGAMQAGAVLTAAGRRVLGTLNHLKDETIAVAIRMRGGGGAQVQFVSSELRHMRLGDVANLAAAGNAAARTAIKVVKDASRLARK